ncbi:MAG: acyl carrier protein [Candidatus Brocadiaceae bacterium]|nr:acyl carrier protein [Candidatus Brocadiaceae bacterium]
MKESKINNVIENTVKERLKKIIAKQHRLLPENISDDANFGKDLGTDSVDMIFLLYKIEEEFNLGIIGEEVGDISTIEGMYNLVSIKA